MAQVLYASTLIVGDPTTRSRVAAAVINYCWTGLLQLQPNPPTLDDKAKAYALSLVNNPGRAIDTYVWALGTYTPVATKALTDYNTWVNDPANAGKSPDVSGILRTSIDDATITTVIQSIWPILSV